MICVNVFYALRKKIQLDPTKYMRISPYTPIVQIANFWKRHDVAKSERFLQWDTMGNFMSFVGSNQKFVSEFIKNIDAYHVSFSLK